MKDGKQDNGKADGGREGQQQAMELIEVREAQLLDAKAIRPMNQPFGSESSPVSFSALFAFLS